MPESSNYIQFKLDDPDHSHNKVNVAGTFNDWNPKSDELSFDDDSKKWLLKVLVGLNAGEKILYKYVVNDEEWICDKDEPHETDSSGNWNNISYVILKDNLTCKNVKDVKTDDEIFDHRDFHDSELFDIINNNTENSNVDKNDSNAETAPTSGDENFPELQTDDDSAIATIKSTGGNNTKSTVTSDLPKTAQNNYPGNSLWESIKWFFKYYIFVWFYPHDSSSSSS